MGSIILTESQYEKLIEQTSNSSAMDLDIYMSTNDDRF